MSKMVMILNLLCHVDVKTMRFLNKALNKAKELDEKQREYFEKEKEKNEIKKQEKERIKDGEDIIKRIMGSNMMRNVQFNNQIINQGVSTFKINSVWGKVNKQIKKELHDRFNDSRVNKVNRRKEFFNITIDEVKQIVEENKADVHSFVEHPDAEEYYDTLKIEEQLNAK